MNATRLNWAMTSSLNPVEPVFDGTFDHQPDLRRLLSRGGGQLHGGQIEIALSVGDPAARDSTDLADVAPPPSDRSRLESSSAMSLTGSRHLDPRQ